MKRLGLALAFAALLSLVGAQAQGPILPGPGLTVASGAQTVAKLDLGVACSATPVMCFNSATSTGVTVTGTISAGATADTVTIVFPGGGATTSVVTSITWSGGGGAYSRIVSKAGTVNGTIESWGAVNPGAATGGTYTINWTGAAGRIAVSHISWTGTKTSSVAAAFPNATTTNSGTAASPVITITSSSGDAVAGTFFDDAALSGGFTLGQSTIYNSTAGNVNAAGYSVPASAGTTNLTATGGGASGTIVAGFDVAHGP